MMVQAADVVTTTLHGTQDPSGLHIDTVSGLMFFSRCSTAVM